MPWPLTAVLIVSVVGSKFNTSPTGILLYRHKNGNCKELEHEVVTSLSNHRLSAFSASEFFSLNFICSVLPLIEFVQSFVKKKKQIKWLFNDPMVLSLNSIKMQCESFRVTFTDL